MAKREDVKIEKNIEIEAKLKKPESIKVCPEDEIMTEQTVE
jgi:hypothetical protein